MQPSFILQIPAQTPSSTTAFSRLLSQNDSYHQHLCVIFYLKAYFMCVLDFLHSWGQGLFQCLSCFLLNLLRLVSALLAPPWSLPTHHATFIFFRCIPKPQVCLTTFDKFGCSQFECLPRQLTCDQVRDPVCDTNHMEHNNLCTLYQRGKSLLYKGPCQVQLFSWQTQVQGA